MSDLQAAHEDYDLPGHYEIRIKGHLDERWADRFAGLTITLEANGETRLTGQIIDQAALHGWLRKVRDLGMPLISVSRVGLSQETRTTVVANEHLSAVKPTAVSTGDQAMNTQRQAAPRAASYRKTAIAAGVLYLITHVTSIGAAALYDPILNHANYVTGTGSDTQVLLGVFFEVILALTVIGTSVALYPVVKRQNEGVALGYVGLRTLEAGIIALGVVPLLALVTLRQLVGTDGTDPTTLITLGHTLVAFHNWTFILGPGLVCGTNTVLMAYLMYQSRLVPRFIPTLGLIGGPLIFAVNTAQLFGSYDPLPVWAAIVVLPIFAWEVTLALWLIFKGFRSFPSAVQPANRSANELVSAT